MEILFFRGAYVLLVGLVAAGLNAVSCTVSLGAMVLLEMAVRKLAHEDAKRGLGLEAWKEKTTALLSKLRMESESIDGALSDRITALENRLGRR